MRLQWLISGWAFSEEMSPVSSPRYNWHRTSAQDPLAIYRNRTSSFRLCRSYPSAMLEEIERDARKIWSRKNKSGQFRNSKNRILLSCLASCQMIRSSNFIDPPLISKQLLDRKITNNTDLMLIPFCLFHPFNPIRPC